MALPINQKVAAAAAAAISQTDSYAAIADVSAAADYAPYEIIRTLVMADGTRRYFNLSRNVDAIDIAVSTTLLADLRPIPANRKVSLGPPVEFTVTSAASVALTTILGGIPPQCNYADLYLGMNPVSDITYKVDGTNPVAGQGNLGIGVNGSGPLENRNEVLGCRLIANTANQVVNVEFSVLLADFN